MASITIAEYQIKVQQLIADNEKKVKEMDKLVAEKDKQIKELKNELEKMNRNKTLTVNNNDDKIKKVLEFKAQLMSVQMIYEKMKFLGFNIYSQEIIDIVSNIDCLNLDMQTFYAECLKKVEDSININNSILKQTLVIEYSQLLDSVSRDLSTLDSEVGEKDLQMKINLRKEKKDILNSIANFSKNIDDREVADEVSSVITDMEEEYEKSKSNIISFNKDWLNSIKAV